MKILFYSIAVITWLASLFGIAYFFHDNLIRFPLLFILSFSVIYIWDFIRHYKKQYYWFASYIGSDGLRGNVFFDTKHKEFDILELSDMLRERNDLDKKPTILFYKRINKKQYQININK